MMYRNTLLLFLTFFMFSATNAQNSWTLQRCIEYAQQNNLSTRQAEYNIKSAELNHKLNQYSRLPSLNGQVRAGYQFGRTIDPTTNSFKNQSIGFNTYGINAAVTVYGGNAINNQIAQSKVDLRASKLEAEGVVNNTAMDIAAAYLNILLAEEQLANAQKQLELSQTQLEQTDKLIKAGSLPPNDRLDFLSQIAINEQAIINAQNSVTIGYLNLKQLMELDPSESFQIVRPASIEIPADANPGNYLLDEVYTAALQTQPQIRAADLRLESAQISEDLAKAGFLPNLSLFASLNTNYSSVAQSAIFDVVRLEQTVFINGNPVDFEIEDEIPVDFQNVSFSDQINENFGQTVGINLSVPIYNNHTNKVQMERARLGVLNQQVTNRQQRQQLKADVQNAIANAKAARENRNAAQRSVEASQMAFDNADKRFRLGAINSLEYTTARNNLDRAEVELIRSKYQYLFNLKMVDFYMGRKISLD